MVKQKKKMLWLLFFCICCMSTGLLGATHCGPTWRQPLSVRLPKGTQKQTVRWFRLTFYQLAQQEHKLQDGGDRVRRFLRHFPKQARSTYWANVASWKKRRKQGYAITAIEHFYITMNRMIRTTLPQLKLPLFRYNRKQTSSTQKRTEL